MNSTLSHTRRASLCLPSPTDHMQTQLQVQAPAELPCERLGPSHHLELEKEQWTARLASLLDRALSIMEAG